MTQTTTSHFTIHCRGCDRTVSVPSRRTAFCPHCGVRLRAMRSRKILTVVLALTTVGLLGALVWPAVVATAPQPATPVTAVAQAAGPSEALLSDAQSVRAARLADLNQRANDVRNARQPLVDQVTELSNLSTRITTAVARATDEDRWPVKVAGRSMGHAEADALVAKVAGVLATERKAIDHDADVLARITAAEATLQGELADIDRLRHQLSTDASADVVHQAAAYGGPLAPPPDASDLTADPARPVDVNALLK